MTGEKKSRRSSENGAKKNHKRRRIVAACAVLMLGAVGVEVISNWQAEPAPPVSAPQPDHTHTSAVRSSSVRPKSSATPSISPDRPPVPTSTGTVKILTQSPEVNDYITSADREARLVGILARYGAVVLKAYTDGHSSLGTFDANCSSDNDPGKWVSKGYKPKPGEICTIGNSHLSPKATQQVSVTTRAGLQGGDHFTHQFSGGVISSPNCLAAGQTTENMTVQMLAVTGMTVGVTGYIGEDGRPHSTIGVEDSTVEAQQIDDVVVDCFRTIAQQPR